MKGLLPARLIAKLQKISNQIDFITKYFLFYILEQRRFSKQELSTMENS